jgi:hypothetical protein
MLEERKMRKFMVILAAVLLLATAAHGVSPVYGPITALFSGTSNGIATTPVIGNALDGDTTLVSVAAGTKYRLMRYDFKPQGNVTGTINLKIGSTTVYAIVNAQANNVYGKNLAANFNEGADGDDLIINVPSGADVYYNIDGRAD